MKIKFENTFKKDLIKISDQKVKQKIKEIILNIQNVQFIYDIKNLKKLSNQKTFYRIRIQNYRIGIEIITHTIFFVRILPRKDIYKYFPK